MIKQILKKTDPMHLYFWMVNAVVFNLCRIVPFRNKRIWVFGESGGTSYTDNTRYLFEYTCSHDLKTTAVWLSANRSIVGMVRSKGLRAYTFYSPQGIWYALRAGVAVYNKSLADFGNVPLVGGAKLVTTWHGAGFKKIYRAAETMQGRVGSVRNVMEKLFNWTRMDLIMATSAYQKKQFLERFDITPNQIVVTGQPRNDTLMMSIDKECVLSKLDMPPHCKLVLYMPTYRPSTQGKGIEEKIVLGLVNNEELAAMLNKLGFCFLVKLHPNTKKFEIGSKPPFYMYSQTKVSVATQDLLIAADMLITDYSSCYVDYSLLRRPVLFYVPDEADYIPHMEGMDKEYYDICSLCQAYDIKGLIGFLEHPKDVVSEMTNNLFLEPETLKQTFSFNAYQAIVDKVFPGA